MKLFGSSKILINQNNDDDNVLSLEVVEAVLVQRNLVVNQCQQKSDE